MNNYSVIGKQAEYFTVSSIIGEGFEVFSSMTENSRVDYVVLDKDSKKLYKIQVKTTTSIRNGCLQYHIKKSSTNYTYRYKDGDFDLYAFVYLPTYEIMYRRFQDVKSSNSIYFRIEKSKNNQQKNVNMWTPNTLKSILDEIQQ